MTGRTRCNRPAGKRGADADETTTDQMAEINDQANRMEAIFRNLKLADPATYDALAKVVAESTRRNESVADIVSRLRALGEVGSRLAETIQNLSPKGALVALARALDNPD